MINAIFLDRDGTIGIGTPTFERVDSLDKVELLPNSIEALSILATLDYSVFIITNQAGLSEGLIGLEDFEEINNKLLSLITPSGIKIEKTFVCPHTENDNCECRKPKPKLILDAAREFDIDLSSSWIIGDRPTDVETGVNAGTHKILVRTGVPDVDSDVADAVLPSLLEAVEFIRDYKKL
jgi:D-glycero-D-manno-heptose 1,7-bisphosphate phosphatase